MGLVSRALSATPLGGAAVGELIGKLGYFALMGVHGAEVRRWSA